MRSLRAARIEPSVFIVELPEFFIELPELLLEGIVELDEDDEGIVLDDDDGGVEVDDGNVEEDDDGIVEDEDEGIVLDDDGVVVDDEDEGVVVSVVVVVEVVEPGVVVVLVLDGEVVDGVEGDGEVAVDWATATPPIIRQAAAIAVVDLRNLLMKSLLLRLTNAHLGVPGSETRNRATQRICGKACSQSRTSACGLVTNCLLVPPKTIQRAASACRLLLTHTHNAHARTPPWPPAPLPTRRRLRHPTTA